MPGRPALAWRRAGRRAWQAPPAAPPTMCIAHHPSPVQNSTVPSLRGLQMMLQKATRHLFHTDSHTTCRPSMLLSDSSRLRHHSGRHSRLGAWPFSLCPSARRSLFPCCAAARNLHHAGAPAPRAARLAPAQPWGSSLIQRGGSSPCSTGVAAAAGRQPDDSQCDSEGEDPEAFSPLPPQARPVLVRLSSLLRRWLPAVAPLAGLVQPQLISYT